ncbi:hypothetical protein [Lactobacillus sp. CBA3605]|uniref:hypothetical protein n=1 Tax=Lactobacillus sp. CBA3605 TaxID=2099788 RepID=UPI001319BAEC|nr:hypothetical protein [Lactobacillus sp. CBA3605]
MSAEIRRQKLVTKSQSSRLSGLTLMVNSVAQLAGIVVSPVIANGLSPAEVFVVCGLLIITIALFGIIFGNRFVRAN